jgi:prepilin-type N-terminal cleavage/methylation domain-containing protein
MYIKGFSLIEMAIVLVIISLLAMGLLTPIAVQMDLQKIKQTDGTLEEIKEALLGFAVINERLPCSDKDGNGIEDFPCKTIATNAEGYLPWANLGVGRYDGWGKPFRYRVEEEYADAIVPNISSGLKVKDIQDINLIATSDTRVAAIIFSEGKNKQSDKENKGGDKTYMRDGYIENTFDDRLTWLSEYTLMNHLLLAEKLPQ